MRAFIDTNIFVYASYSKFTEHKKAREFLKKCVTGPDLWYLSWSVAYEYLRVATHPQLFPRKALSFGEALDNVLKFSKSPYVEILRETPEHGNGVQQLNKELPRLHGNILHDVHTAVLMREHELKKIMTADTDFHRFKEIEAVNPLR